MDLSKVEKFEDLSFAQWVAYANKGRGLEGVLGSLRGELEISVKRIVKILFDKYGRRIPKVLSTRVCDADRKFHLDQLYLAGEVHYANRIERLCDKLGVDMGVTGKQLQNETQRLFELIHEDTLTAHIARGVHLPVVCPKLVTSDLGGELEYYLTAVGKSYTDEFPKREFYNHLKGRLDGIVSVIEGSRHGKLLDRMKGEAVIGLYFPNPLQGFSINASREQMASLPEGFILSGLDAVIAMIMYPDVLARDGKAPGLELAALSWRSAGCSLDFRVLDNSLQFCNAESLAGANDSYSSGLLFLG